MKTIAELVGKNIRARRVSLGITQTDLAKSAKISNITLNRIEKGKQAPQGASLQMIAEALLCTPEDLYSSPSEAPLGTRADILDAIREGLATNLSKSVTTLSPEKQKLIDLVSAISDKEDILAITMLVEAMTSDKIESLRARSK